MSEQPIELTPELYAHLRHLAIAIHSEKGGGQQTINPTVLLHEAWAKVARSNGQYESQRHFVAVAAKAMRQILLDHARDRGRQKRGGQRVQTTLSGLGEERSVVDVVALDTALTELESLDPLAARVATLRTIGGMTAAEMAEALETSESSIRRSWRFARVFLADRLA